MRAARIFVNDLSEHKVLDNVHSIKITLYGSLALTGLGHYTPQAITWGLENVDPEDLSFDVNSLPSRFNSIIENNSLVLSTGKEHKKIKFDINKDINWRKNEVLPRHPNGMQLSAFSTEGDLLATNTYYSIGGGFVISDQAKINENIFYKEIKKSQADPSRREQHATLNESVGVENKDNANNNDVPYPFHNAESLLELTKKHNLTIAQIVYNNELKWFTPGEINEKLWRIWKVMDDSILSGVSATDELLPGPMKVKKRARYLYNRLQNGLYEKKPLIGSSSTNVDQSMIGSVNLPYFSPKTNIVTGDWSHPLKPINPRKTINPSLDFLLCYAIAVNETNAVAGRVVTAPTNGSAGVIPSVLKYLIEFLSDDPIRDVPTFLLTASAIGMLIKRGATISAAEGM